MLIGWFIGLLLNLFIVFLWRCRYIQYRDVNTGIQYWGRMRVNIIVVILFIVTSFVPVLNIILPISIWGLFLMMGACICKGWDDEWRFPKWMTKTIE